MRTLFLLFTLGVHSAQTGVCEGPGAELDIHDHCACTGDNTQSGLDGSSCECVKYHMEWEGTCIPCSGPGAYVDNGECLCDPALNSELIVDFANKEYDEQVCACSAGSIYDYDLDRVNGYHDEVCVLCSGPGAIVENGECVCTGYGEEYTVFNDGVCSCNDVAQIFFHVSTGRDCCILCSGPGSYVDADSGECLCENGAVSINTAVCACPEGSYEWDNGCVVCSGVGAVFNEGVCSCADNASLVDGICTCDADFVHYILGDDCRSCGAFAELNQADGECVCSDPFATINADGDCECNEGFLLFGGACIACSGPGAQLTSSGTCSCADSNAEVVNNVCTCKTGFQYDGTECINCAGSLTFIEDGVCACPAGYVLNSDFTCTLCPSGVLIENSILCNFEIEGGRWVNGVIECNPDYFYFDEEGTCIKCAGPGAYPRDGVCACRAEAMSILSPDVPGLCICDESQNAVDFDDGCKTCTGQGAKLVDGECTCGLNAVLTWETTGWVCVCNAGFLAGDDGNCYQCIGGVFDPATQECVCENDRLLEGVECVCPEGTFPTDDECVLCEVASDLVVGFIEEECVCQRNAIFDAVTGTCSCDAGYKQFGEACIRCEIDLTDGECLCEEGFLMFNFGELCVPCVGFNAHLVGDVCTCGQFEELVDDECTCVEGYQLFGESCVRCAGLGAELDATGQCVCTVENSFFVAGVTGLECQCAPGFFEFEGACVACAAPAVFLDGACTCDESLFLELNAAGDGCQCFEGYSLASTGECIKCDTESDYFFGFFNDVCKCVVDASLDEDSSCVCDEGFVGFEGACVACDITGEAFLSAAGVCSCPEGFMLFGGNTCVACSGLGARLDLDGVCVCGPHEELVDDVCQCKADFLAHPDGFCVACRGIGAELVNGECTCTDENYTLQLVENKPTCACADGLRAGEDGNCYVCNYGVFDAATAVCSCDETEFKVMGADGETCECQEGYLAFFDNDDLTCVQCDEEAEAFEIFEDGVCVCKPGGVLVDGVCSCGTNFLFDADSATCVPCIADTGAFLEAGVCTCPENFMMFGGNACVACAGIGARLTVDGICECANFASINDNDPLNVFCECDENFLPFNDETCVMCSGVGAVLNEDGVCSCGPGAFLNVLEGLLQCVCPLGWTEFEGACIQCDNGVVVNGVCTCDAALNLILNADSTGCVCDEANFFLTASDGTCTLCDTSADLIDAFVDDECVCVANAVYANGECTCEAGFLPFGAECIKCDVDGGSIFADGVCSCEEGFLFFDGFCVACSGLSAQLDEEGLCQCGQYEVLVDGVCECISDEFMVSSIDTCVHCYGIGAMLNGDDTCVCDGVEDAQFDAVAVGFCVCKPGLFQFLEEKCVQCDAFGFTYDEKTGECFDEAGTLVEASVAEIRAKLDAYQLCVMDFFTVSALYDPALEKDILITLFGMDFSTVEVGGLKDFINGFSGEFEAIGFNVNLLMLEGTEDNFFSIDQLINILSVFNAQGFNIADPAFMTELKGIATAAFFAQTELTFTFTQFEVLFVWFEYTLERLVVQLRLSGLSLCVGPGIFTNAAGDCECSIPLTFYDINTFSCNCNLANGLIFDEASETCVCQDTVFSTLVGESCEFVSLDLIKAELDTYQMCVGNFITTAFDVTDIDAVYRLVYDLDFTGFVVGGFTALFEGIKADLGALVDVELVFGQLFAIELVINVISIMAANGVDIAASIFKTDLDLVITGIVDFWTLTATTFSFSLFGAFFVSFGIDLSIIIAGFGDVFLPCFGFGAEVINGVCECGLEFSVYDAATGECGCLAGLVLENDVCSCTGYTTLQSDGSCLPFTAVMWEERMDVYQMCFASFLSAQATLSEADYTLLAKYIALNIDFGGFDLATGLTGFFDADFTDFMGTINLDFGAIEAAANFFSFQRLVDIVFIMGESGVDIASAAFMGDIRTAVTVDFFVMTELTFSFHMLMGFFASYAIEVSFIVDQMKAVGFVLCTGEGAVVVNGLCTCTGDYLFNGISACLECSGPTAALENGVCTCDGVSYQLDGDELECILCDATTASLVAGVCTCNDANALIDSNAVCLPCFGPTAFLDNDACACGPGYILNNGEECIACSGPTASLVGGVCTCDDVDYQIFGSECLSCNKATAFLDNGVCTCIEANALITSLNVCVSCFGPTAFLDNDVCACGPGHLQNNGEECIPCSGPTAQLVNGVCACDRVNYQKHGTECVLCDFATASLNADGVCECNEGNALFNSASVCVSCFGPTAFLDNDACACGDGYILNNGEECIACSGPTASLAGGVCTCDDVDYQIFGSECLKCDAATASLVGGVCTCNAADALMTSAMACIPCFGETAFLDNDQCACGEGYLLNNGEECIACSGPTAYLSNGACACDNVDYQLFGSVCLSCQAATATLDASGACVCKNPLHQLKSDNSCIPCSGPTAQLVNDVCECGAGFLISSANVCIPCSGPTAFLSGDQCTCGDGFIFFDGACVACSGQGAKLVNGACTCPLDFSSLVGDACECDAGFKLSGGACVCADANKVLAGGVCIGCEGPGASVVNDACVCGASPLGVGVVELINGVCTCPANSVANADGTACALVATTTELLITTYLGANVELAWAKVDGKFDLSLLTNDGSNIMAFLYEKLVVELGVEAAFTLTSSVGFSLFVFIIDVLYSLVVEVQAVSASFSLAAATDVAGFVNLFSVFTDVSAISFAQFSSVLSGMAAFFTVDISAAVAAVNTEVLFLNFQETAKVNIGKFCGGFYDDTNWGVTSNACVCLPTFVAEVDSATGFVTCACPAGQSQVDGACVAQAQVAALTKTIDIEATIVTAFPYTAALGDSTTAAFKSAAATVVKDVTTVMSRSAKVTSSSIEVVSFRPHVVSVSGRRRREDEQKAEAVIEGTADVPEDASANEVAKDIQETIENSTDDDFESLDVESFAKADFDVVTTTTVKPVHSTPSGAVLTSVNMALITTILFYCM